MSIKKYPLMILTTLGLLSTGALFAQTPDGLTPANEGICDSLKADGVTKGLYGLCIAFCEAHDADLTSNQTIENLDVPNTKILANYRKKMQAGDPDMPCVSKKVECPCNATPIGTSILYNECVQYETVNEPVVDRLYFSYDSNLGNYYQFDSFFINNANYGGLFGGCVSTTDSGGYDLIYFDGSAEEMAAQHNACVELADTVYGSVGTDCIVQ